MSDTVQTITDIQRIKNSRNGNPRYRITFANGSQARTRADSAFTYEITGKWVGMAVCVTYDARGYIRNARPEPHGETGRTTCNTCHHEWCGKCDPGPSALCHYCHGRGYSTAPMGMAPGFGPRSRCRQSFMAGQECSRPAGHDGPHA